MCPAVENPDLVFQATCDSQGLTHSRPAEHDSSQAIQARPDHPDRVVSPSRGLSIDMLHVAPTSDRFLCYDFVSPVTDPLALTVDALSLSWEDLDPYAFPPVAILGKQVKL